MHNFEKRYETPLTAQRDKELVASFKSVNWEALNINTAQRRELQSFRDRVRAGASQFSIGTDERITPLLDKLGIKASFSPVYLGEIDGELCGSKLEISDFFNPAAVELSIDAEDWLKLKNIHF